MGAERANMTPRPARRSIPCAERTTETNLCAPSTDRASGGLATSRLLAGRTSDRPMTAEPFSKAEMMIVAAARELAGQHVCFVGVGLPNIAVNLAKRTVAPELELVYEAGVFGARPARLPLSI